ncbi:hypothetical protein I545_3782 [Mycobacterium kansasii 662]|uniref:Uncharacterized protein n=2 Tax=Mycobacterium kansasii TaxID=1768 RepID=A0A1V3XD07_MYCKA|nr:hypothetical protein I545_3782 [Mycobacterium kansasii 662]OOK77062.1 hypothetical protein BZL29_3686 [Mycobacterium kansasii]
MGVKAFRRPHGAGTGHGRARAAANRAGVEPLVGPIASLPKNRAYLLPGYRHPLR